MTLRVDRGRVVREHATEGVVRSGRRMLAILVNMARTRLGLLAVELMEEKSRIWLMLVLTGLAMVFALMALAMLSLLVVVALWEENRLLAIGGLLAFYLLAAGITLLVARKKAKVGSAMFASTLRELSQDGAELEDRIEAEEMDFDAGRGRRRD